MYIERREGVKGGGGGAISGMKKLFPNEPNV